MVINIISTTSGQHLSEMFDEIPDLSTYTTITFPNNNNNNNNNNNINNGSSNFDCLDLLSMDKFSLDVKEVVAPETTLLADSWIFEEGATYSTLTSAKIGEVLGWEKEDHPEPANIPATVLEAMDVSEDQTSLIDQDVSLFQVGSPLQFEDDITSQSSSPTTTSSISFLPTSSQYLVSASPGSVQATVDSVWPATADSLFETSVVSSSEPGTSSTSLPTSTAGDVHHPQTLFEYSDDATTASDVSTPGLDGLTSGNTFLFPLPADDKMAAATLTALETCSLTPLLKEELKYTIQSRRLAAGKPELVVEFNRPVKERKVMTEEERKRNVKRREQNRTAAQRFRQKQKDTVDTLSKRCRRLENSNSTLRTKIEQLAKERQQLQQFLDCHLQTCNKVKPSS